MSIEPRHPNNLIYLACPYTHPNPHIRQWRVDTCAMASAALRLRHWFVYAPIVECHATEHFMPGDCGAFEFWQEYNMRMLRAVADELWVLELPGWDQSKGVIAEIDAAVKADMPVQFIIASAISRLLQDLNPDPATAAGRSALHQSTP